MIYLLYSDLHNRLERLKDVETVLEAIPKFVEEYKVDWIINGGDTFNTRGVISTKCFDLLQEHYIRWFKKGYKQKILIGNHDQEDLEGQVHPMNVFGQFTNWDVIYQPTFDGELGIAFFPYMNSHIEESINVLAPKSKEVPVDAIVHWGIRGAKRNDVNIDSEGVPLELLAPFRRVFAGHYHLRQDLPFRVSYIGSPYQQNFAEMGQEKGVIIWDQEADTKEFVSIDGTSKHYEINFEWGKSGFARIHDKSHSNILSNDIVKFKVTGDQESVKLFDKNDCANDLGLKTKNITVNRTIKEKSFSRLGIKSSDIHNTETIMTKYVNHVETDLDKSKLLEIGRDILGK